MTSTVTTHSMAELAKEARGLRTRRQSQQTNEPSPPPSIRLGALSEPVPRAIRLNMLRLRWTIDAQARWKNGQPAHRTTGVESAN